VQGGDNALLEIAPPNDEPFVDPDGNPVDRDSPPPRDDARPDEGLPPDDDRPPADDDEDNRDPRQAGAMAGAGA